LENDYWWIFPDGSDVHDGGSTCENIIGCYSFSGELHFPSITPRYELLVNKDGRNHRWDPCSGEIRVGINPNGQLSQQQFSEWEGLIKRTASELSVITGLSLVYSGQTAEVPATGYDSHGSIGKNQLLDAHILIFFGPPGSSALLGPDSSNEFFSEFRDLYSGQRELNNIQNGIRSSWYEMMYFAIHINTAFEDWELPGNAEIYFMSRMGQAMGLVLLDEWTRSEIMGYGVGSGTLGEPQWGPGDRIGLALLGSNNGCF